MKRTVIIRPSSMQMTVTPSEQIWRNSALLDLLTNCLREPPLVICQVIDKLKLVLLFAVQYLTGRIKMTLFSLVMACSASFKSDTEMKK